MAEKLFSVPESTLNAIGEYLTSRPYREVAALVAALARSQPVDQTPRPEEGEKEPQPAQT